MEGPAELNTPPKRLKLLESKTGKSIGLRLSLPSLGVNDLDRLAILVLDEKNNVAIRVKRDRTLGTIDNLDGGGICPGVRNLNSKIVAGLLVRNR